MNETNNTKKYDLEERTFNFAKKVRQFTLKLDKNLNNIDDIKQLLRSSGSIGANYIEANESLSKKDFFMRIKICRKEAKETQYWLRLIEVNNNELQKIKDGLTQEAVELTKIFGSIVKKE